MTTKRPDIFFAHGGWRNPSCLEVVRKLLENDGLTCHIPQLPSSSENAASMTIRDDVQLIHDVLQTCIEAGNDVLVVGHSNGGFTVCGALEGLLGEETTTTAEGKVLGIAMIAAFIPPAVGKGAFNRVPPIDTSWLVFNESEPTFLPNDPKRLFYNDLSDAEADFWTKQIRPMHIPGSPDFYEAWRYVPMSYLLCEDDVAQPPAFQEAMVKAAQAEGGSVVVERVESGHSPFLSMPNVVVAWIERSVEQFGKGRQVGKASA